MPNILIINTGGTFNKNYDPLNGTLFVDTTSKALENIASKWLCEFEIINIIGKDSLDITTHDRMELLVTISHTHHEHIIIIHGTDTMSLTAEYLDDGELEKSIVLTGAMVPYNIDSVEATANLCSAYGYLNALKQEGVYIAMNGVIGEHTQIKKDRTQGKFIYV